jgi:hypothetical protein
MEHMMLAESFEARLREQREMAEGAKGHRLSLRAAASRLRSVVRVRLRPRPLRRAACPLAAGRPTRPLSPPRTAP